MFKHLLVPTDGSALSDQAAHTAAAIAKATGARVTAFYVAPPYKLDLNDNSPAHKFIPQDSYIAAMSEQSNQHLNRIQRIAAAAGVECTGRFALSDAPADAIVEAAQKYGCDAVVMGSHRRSGVKKLLLGSVSQKVLISATMPVVITR